MPNSSPLLTARSLVLLQLLSRILTFTLNQTLLRLASPAVFGTAAIQFDLVCSTILFLSREGIRNALLRKTDRGTKEGETSQSQEQIHALSLVPFRLGMVVAALVAGVYLQTSAPATTSQPRFHLSLALYILSALVELSIEPYYIRVHRSKPPKLNVRVQAEGGMAIIKAVVTVASLLGLGEDGALLSFALGQLSGALWLALRYVKEFDWEVRSLALVQTKESHPRYDAHTFSLALANTGQSLIKHVLTEADRLAVARISPLDDQGGYAVAMNYGSLVARIVFQPLEETLLLHYSNSPGDPSTRDLFALTIRLALYLGTIVQTFVPPLFPAIAPLLIPRQYHGTSAPGILQLYLKSYIPLLCLNGVSEAFHTASANPDQVKLQAQWMLASSCVFAGSLYLLDLTRPIVQSQSSSFFLTVTFNREQALVLASCAAMVLRIIYALCHARRYFALRGASLSWSSLMPSVTVLMWAGAARLVLSLLAGSGRWEHGWAEWGMLIAVGGGFGLATLGFIYLVENRKLDSLRRAAKPSKVE